MKIIERNHNAVTGEITDIERDLTVEELAERKAYFAEQETKKAKQAAKDAAKQAVLDKLGLSADEVALLLG